MRSIRWKSSYSQHDPDLDRNNKRLVGCFNQLTAAAEKKEHCQEMEEFLTTVGLELETALQQNKTEIVPESKKFFTKILERLPLQTYSTTACRKCGLCDMAQAKIAEHLRDSVDCLQNSAPQSKSH